MNSSICNYNVSMRNLLVAINEEPAGIAFIIDENAKLCGLVTDGDFRRMLLAGKSLDESLQKDDLGEFVFAKQGEDIESLLTRTDHKIRVLPILNDRMELVDYFRYEHRVHMMPVAEPDLRGNEFKYLSDAFLSSWISSIGVYIDRFEEGFSGYCGSEYGIATSNCTTALHLALLALDIGPGDEVIVPDLTFAASINAVLHANATPVIVDIDPESWCIDPAEIKKAISAKTRAIMPVHLYGQPCDMDAIMGIANRHNLYVIEDAAEAHGAEYKEQKVGTFGDIGCYSFFGNKIMTTGEGGMCLTNSLKLNERIRILRDHGMNKSKRYWHDVVGYNYRMTNLQAAIGCSQLERIDEFLKERINLEGAYKNNLQGTAIFEWQKDYEHSQRVVWLVSALLKNQDRDSFILEAKNHGVDIRPFFYPLSEMPIYKEYVFSSGNSVEVSSKGINFPTVANKVDFSQITSAVQASLLR